MTTIEQATPAASEKITYIKSSMKRCPNDSVFYAVLEVVDIAK